MAALSPAVEALVREIVREELAKRDRREGQLRLAQICAEADWAAKRQRHGAARS